MIYQRIQTLSFIQSYAENDGIGMCYKKLLALAPLPCGEVEGAYYNLRPTSSTTVKDTPRQLFMRFNQQWIYDVLIEMWNVNLAWN